MKKILLFFLILIMLISLTFMACGGNGLGSAGGAGGDASSGGGSAQANEPLTIYPSLLIVPLGQHVTLQATAKGDKAVTWSSSDTSVATIDENGRLSPVAEGETIITVALADDASVTDACGVRVTSGGNIFLWE